MTPLPSRALLLLLALCAVGGLATSATAQPRDDGAPADAMGRGDNVRASVWGPAALYFNPAGMSRVQALIVQVGYGYLDGKDGHAFSASAVDAKTNDVVALGLSYDFITGAPGGVDRDGHQFRGGLSTGYHSRDVSIYAGVGVRFLTLELGKDDGDTEDPLDPSDLDLWTLDAGLIFDIGRRIRFGVVGSNLVDTGADEAPRELGLGLGFVFDALEVSADMSLDLTDRDVGAVARYGFGAEYLIAGAFHTRAGLTIVEHAGRPDSAQERLAFGIGYSTPEFALDLGYSWALADESDIVFGVSFRYAPATGGGGPQTRR